jgi:hypothetical protein
MEQPVAPEPAKIIKIITEEINASNKSLMKRREKLLSKLRKSRKKARKGGAA